MTAAAPTTPNESVNRAASEDRAGLLAVDKPAGVTSHDVIDAVRARLRIARAGHLGTLDPGATGLLLVATGPATRAIPALQGGDKTYEGTLRFGVVTTTQDLEGDVIETSDRVPSEADVRRLALTGEIEQVPPMVSALKHHGERLYRLARRGTEVERRPRRVHVRAWEWLGFEDAGARFRVVCSGGTYVRTLVHDLGQRLGCGAALEQLRRLRSEPFGLERSIELRELAALDEGVVWDRAGRSLEQALEHMPALTLSAAEVEAVGHGARPVLPGARVVSLPVASGARSIVLVGSDGRVVALGELIAAADAFEVRARVVFPWASAEGGHR